MSIHQAGALIGKSGSMYAYYERGEYEMPYHLLEVLSIKWNAPELLNATIGIEPAPVYGQLKFVGDIPGGSWDLSSADETYVDVPIEMVADDHVAGRIRGNSMAPSLVDEDLVIIKLTKTPPIGKIVVVRSSEGEHTAKRYVKIGNDNTLVADNGDAEPIVMKDCEFVGYVRNIYYRQL